MRLLGTVLPGLAVFDVTPMRKWIGAWALWLILVL
jgi:hypothetical protein